MIWLLWHMKKLSIFVWVIILLVVMTSSAYARSGCCSHHGGVSSDGCGCNDGTSLLFLHCKYLLPSAYHTKYWNTNSCTNQSYSSHLYSPANRITDTPPIVNDVSTITSPVQVKVAGDNASGNPISELFGLGVVGGLGYLAWRKIKNRGNKNSLPPNETTQK